MKRGDEVAACENLGEVSVGDIGVVVARWLMPQVTVRWHKDGRLRRVHRKRLRLLDDFAGLCEHEPS